MGESKVDNGFSSPFCIIPAAGRSSRMGKWKPMLPWRDGTLCQAVLDTVESAGCRPILVAGYRAEELIAEFGNRAETIVTVNEKWEQGMLGTILAGAKHAGEPGFFVVPADMPFLPASIFRNIASLAGSRKIGGKEPTAIFAAHAGKLGHPVWIPSEFLAEIERLPPNAKLRDYLLTQRWTACEAETDAIWIDLDDPEEYAKALALNALGTKPGS